MFAAFYFPFFRPYYHWANSRLGECESNFSITLLPRHRTSTCIYHKTESGQIQDRAKLFASVEGCKNTGAKIILYKASNKYLCSSLYIS